MGEWGPAALVFDDVRVPDRERSSAKIGQGFKLAMRVDPPGPLHPPGPGAGRVRADGRDGDGARHTRGDLRASDRRQAGDPVDDRRLRGGDGGAALAQSVGRVAGRPGPGLAARPSIAKLYGGIKANKIVDRMLQIHGGMGYTRELPIERWYRELRLLPDLRGHRRDPAADDQPEPAPWPRLGARRALTAGLGESYDDLDNRSTPTGTVI